jgi:hypothetical protein
MYLVLCFRNSFKYIFLIFRCFLDGAGVWTEGLVRCSITWVTVLLQPVFPLVIFQIKFCIFAHSQIQTIILLLTVSSIVHITSTHHHTQLVHKDGILINSLPCFASNYSPPYLHLSSSCDYSCAPLHPFTNIL